MALTFKQIISAWGKCMNENDHSELTELLADDFVWHSAVPEHKAPSDDKADKAETIEFTLGAEIRIGDYNTIYDGNDVVSGTHSAMIDDGTEKVVFCQGLLTEGGIKVKSWRHLIGDYPES
jgi:hypothetical protein